MQKPPLRKERLENKSQATDNTRTPSLSLILAKTRKRLYVFNLACVCLMEQKEWLGEKKGARNKSCTVSTSRSEILKCSNSVIYFGTVMNLKRSYEGQQTREDRPAGRIQAVGKAKQGRAGQEAEVYYR